MRQGTSGHAGSPAAACELAAYEYIVQALLAQAIPQTLTRMRGSRSGRENMPCLR